MRSWFFLFEILQYIRHQKYMTQRISRPSRSVPRPYYYYYYFSGWERTRRPQKNVWDQDIRSYLKIPEDWMLWRAKDFTFTTTESSFCPKSQRSHSFFVSVGIDCVKNTNISRTNTKQSGRVNNEQRTVQILFAVTIFSFPQILITIIDFDTLVYPQTRGPSIRTHESNPVCPSGWRYHLLWSIHIHLRRNYSV